jgi:hypothetical protein
LKHTWRPEDMSDLVCRLMVKCFRQMSSSDGLTIMEFFNISQFVAIDIITRWDQRESILSLSEITGNRYYHSLLCKCQSITTIRSSILHLNLYIILFNSLWTLLFPCNNKHKIMTQCMALLTRCWLSCFDFLLTKSFRLFDLERPSWRLYTLGHNFVFVITWE